MKKLVTLFGGSFDPTHEGHTRMASYLYTTFQTEVWMMCSQNPFKSSKHYSSLEDRLNMGAIMLAHCKEPIVMSGLYEEIAKEKGRHETFYVLQGLKKRFPDTQFIWSMGADNFSEFHKWKERDAILADTIIAVLDRPGYREAALRSPTAIQFAQQRIDITQKDALKNTSSGWCFLDNPLIDLSSSGILQKLAEGKTDFSGPFAEVVDYIYEHGLYGTAKHKPLISPPTYTTR